MGEKPSRHMTAAGPSKHLERADSLIINAFSLAEAFGYQTGLVGAVILDAEDPAEWQKRLFGRDISDAPSAIFELFGHFFMGSIDPLLLLVRCAVLFHISPAIRFVRCLVEGVGGGGSCVVAA